MTINRKPLLVAIVSALVVVIGLVATLVIVLNRQPASAGPSVTSSATSAETTTLASVVPTSAPVTTPPSFQDQLSSALEDAGVTYTPVPGAPQTAYDYMLVICEAQMWKNPDGSISGNAAYQELGAIDQENMKRTGSPLDLSQSEVSKIGVSIMCPSQGGN